jgi:hypothetical protein
VPGATTTIDRGQREGLYELVRNHLGSIEDFFVALELAKDLAGAEAEASREDAETDRRSQLGYGPARSCWPVSIPEDLNKGPA